MWRFQCQQFCENVCFNNIWIKGMDQRYGAEVWNGSFKQVWNGDGSQIETSWAKLGQDNPTAWNVPWPRQKAADGAASRAGIIRKQGKRRQVLNIAQHCSTHMPPACHLYKLSERRETWNACHKTEQNEQMNSDKLSTSSFNILAAVAVTFGARNAWIYNHQNRLQILK